MRSPIPMLSESSPRDFAPPPVDFSISCHKLPQPSVSGKIKRFHRLRWTCLRCHAATAQTIAHARVRIRANMSWQAWHRRHLFKN